MYTHVYMYTYIHICMYICVHTYIYTCIHMYLYVISYVCMHTSIYLSMYYESIWIHLSHMWIRIQIHKFSSVAFKASSPWLRTRRVLSFDYEHMSSKIISMYKNPSVTDWKSRSRMLQIGLLLSEIPWVCLSGRDLHRPFKFVLKAVWNNKISLCSWR